MDLVIEILSHQLILFLRNMVLVYCKLFNSRCKFIFDWVFGQCGINYTTTNVKEEFQRSPNPKIWYASEKPPSDEACWIFAGGLIFDNRISTQQIRIIVNEGVPQILFQGNRTDFDFFSAVFYMLSRYEEYLPFVPDRHGRFPASEGIAFKGNFLDIPVVDFWVQRFRQQLLDKFPDLVFKPEKFRAVLTFDLDVFYKYKGRSGSRQLMSAAKDVVTLKWNNLFRRLKVLSGMKGDPYDVYYTIEKNIRNSQLEAIFFIPCGRRSRFDNNLSPQNSTIKRKIRELKKYASIGLHPSYKSSDNPGNLVREKSVLEKILNEKVKSGRQHFLRFKLPGTFQTLANSGMECDYSMGFAEAPGFRAGTSKPFYFYDLKNERQTSLKLYPVCWMDATFLNYVHSEPTHALKIAEDLIEKIKQVNGYFIPIFHNDVLTREGFLNVHLKIVEDVIKAGRDE